MTEVNTPAAPATPAPIAPAPATPAPAAPIAPATAPATAPAVTAPAAPEAKKEYTDKELNGIITRKESEAVNKVLTELGIPTVEDAKKNLAALKAWQDSQKTAEQRAADEAKAATEGKTAAEKRADVAEMKLEALKAGVAQDRLDDLIVLAAGEVGATMAEKVKAAIEKRPWLRGAPTNPGPFGGPVGGGADEKTRISSEVYAAMGLTPPAK